MEVKQFYDKTLSHASYAVFSDKEMVLIDPERDPRPYYAFAREKGVPVTHVLETHLHADFVSSHLQIQAETGAVIHIHPSAEPDYPFQPLTDGDLLSLDGFYFRTLHTPGHSPDSNSFLLLDADGKETALFTGDFLFIGDVGRPDLRESSAALKGERVALAKQMYHSIHHVLPELPGDMEIYPAHGAGSLCGKNMSDQLHDSLENQRLRNWALQSMSEADFVKELLNEQPFVPAYFPYNVELNRMGASSVPDIFSSIRKISETGAGITVIDTRPESIFKKGHVSGSINIQCGKEDKFETWLGTIVSPEIPFFLVVEEENVLEEVLLRVAKIGYEPFLRGWRSGEGLNETDVQKGSPEVHPDASGKYHIIDIREPGEVASKKIFSTSENIPLKDLKAKAASIPSDKPVLVHCAGGYRSAIGSSLLKAERPELEVWDLGNGVGRF